MRSINGIFIPASDEQLAKITEVCAANNLTPDPQGILKLLMMLIEDAENFEEEEDEPAKVDPVESVIRHFANNPEQAEALKQAGAKLFKNIFNKKS